MNNDQDDVVVDEIVEEQDEEGNDKTDWKAIALKNQGIAKRLKTKIEKSKIEAKVDKKVEKVLEEKGLDRIDKAILRGEKITSPAEIELIEAIKKETGKEVEDILESKYFKTELAALRESQATKDATPSGTKRSGQSAKDEVDYWIAKGELPPIDQPQLRAKVVARKREVLGARSQFSDTPVVS